MRERTETGVWWASPHAAAIVALVPTVLSVFVIVHELTLHKALGGVTFPAGGTNFASSLALSKGELPYNNYPTSFPLSQPPGMTLLLLPFAWAAHGGDGGGAMAAARVVTALVSILNVYLVGLTARRHGIASSFIAGTLFAIFPFAFYSTASYMLEPYLVLFCLLGYLAAFHQGVMVKGGRLLAAGVFVGFAVAIKPWAVVPAVALLICSAFNWREALPRVLGGLVLGFGVPCIFFFFASPASFISDVITAELKTGGAASANVGGSRLTELLGMGPPIGVTNGANTALAIGILILVLVILAALAKASTSSMHDWLIIGTAVALTGLALLPTHLPVAYTYFLAAFGAPLLGNTIGGLLSMVSTVSVGTGDVSSTVAGGLTILFVATMIGLIAYSAPKEADFERAFFMKHGNDPSTTIDAFVPKGSCVISNDPEALVLSGRFAQLPGSCPVFPDPSAIVHAAGSPTAGTDNKTVESDWERALGATQFFVLAPTEPGLPDDPVLQTYFGHNFVLVHSATLSAGAKYKIYENKTPLLP